MQYSIIVVDGDFEARSRIKQTSVMLKDWAMIQYVANLAEACDLLQHRSGYDVVIVSYKFGRELIREFVKKAKALPAGFQAAFVVSVSGEQSGISTITGNMILGVDGFLIEPYSMETFIETVELARRVKVSGMKERQEYALKFLLNEILDQLNSIGNLKKRGSSATVSIRILSEMGSVLKELDPELEARYFDFLLQTASESAAPVAQGRIRKKSGAYRVASGRISAAA